MALIELIKIDLEYRWQQRHFPKRIEEYVEEFAELVDEEGVPCDLIYEEFHVRRIAVENVDRDEYARRFPRQADELERLLPKDSASHSTCMFVRNKSKEIEVGQTIDDFHLLSKLGKGAFATVFLAWQISMERQVALKISDDKGKEPQTLAQLNDPHIVRVHDQRILNDRGLRLLLMEYVSGGTLQDVVRHLRRVPRSELYGAKLLQAIDESLAKRDESPLPDSHLRASLAVASWPEVICRIGAQLARALHYAQS